ncbi:N-ethylmaleimide reductase [Paenarthrobacter sp. NEAU-H11]|uniref:N-ethylmaleimide reductase n=1 Tax=Paenarthrobacter sp. NEAU-H11 TaxID=3423924 RepID=UPI003D34398F
MPTLFDPLKLGAVTAPNRVFMAPLTRMRSTQPGDVPNDLMLEYYVQRASAGLIISEGAQISQQGKGYMDTPGIHTEEQVTAWRRVTDAVHAVGGRIACQLWHVGRVSHQSFHDGQLPVAPSALPYSNRTTIRGESGQPTRVDCPTPRALENHEIAGVIETYRQATYNARAAGFDMVEIHAAHGYLLAQFMSAQSNSRTDQYGGSLSNRARLTLEVLDAVTDAWDPAHVGIRISPLGLFNGLDDTGGGPMCSYLAAALAERKVAFLHLSEPDWVGGPQLDDDFRIALRSAFPGTLIGAGNYDLTKANRLLRAGWIDAVAFGRSFLANPDLPRRLQSRLDLNEPQLATFYGGGARGYTDYPTFQPV